MTNFIYDNTSLPTTKSDRNPLPVGEGFHAFACDGT